MQTRKRAKSVSFGKKSKEKVEKEEVKHAQEEAVSSSTESTPEKVDEGENKAVHEKSQHVELSETPPKDEFEVTDSNVETPASEFVADSPLSTTPEQPKNTKESEAVVAEPAATEPAASAESSQPVETPVQTPAAIEQPAAQSEPELSSTLPQSAFTIQSQEEQPAKEEETVHEASGKKPRFLVYFLVVAFLSFILGLGAMAGASYFGLVNTNFSKLPAGIQLPIIGQKATPTVQPPTATPTEKPVDLTTYTIAVLNGSGVSGKAADEKTALTTAGFKVGSTGNADNNNFTKTEISAKKTVSHDYLTKLETELNKTFVVDTTVATSPDSDSADVTVTLGSQTAK